MTTPNTTKIGGAMRTWHDLEQAADHSAFSLYAAEFLGTALGFWIDLLGPALGATVGVALARALGGGERRIDRARVVPNPADPHAGSQLHIGSPRTSSMRSRRRSMRELPIVAKA